MYSTSMNISAMHVQDTGLAQYFDLIKKETNYSNVPRHAIFRDELHLATNRISRGSPSF